MTSVQSPYYNEKLGPVCCHNCGIVIIDPEIITEVAKLKIKFSVVKASCGADRSCDTAAQEDQDHSAQADQDSDLSQDPATPQEQ